MSGRAFLGEVEPIRAAIAPLVQQAIIDRILEKFPDITIIPLGSVGHKADDDTNGDIDLGIIANDVEEISNIVNVTFPELLDTKVYNSYYIVSIKYPYMDGDIEKWVQVDFIQAKDAEYSKFRYACPNYKINESKYKVGAKICLVNLILNHDPNKNINVPEGFKSKYLFEPHGLYRFIYNKNDFTDYKEEFITTDINTVMHIMFTDEITEHDFLSVETLWDAIHSDKFKYFNYPELIKAIELRWFVQCYRKGWESIKPEDFYLQYATLDEIYEIISGLEGVHKINRMLHKLSNYDCEK